MWSGRWRNTMWLVLGIVIGTGATLLVPVVTGGDDLESGELVIISGRDQSGGQRQALIDQWNALHDNIKARIIEAPSKADAQHSEMVARAQSGNNEVDIYNLDVTWTAEFAEHEYIRPIKESSLSDNGFLDRPMRTCRYEGKLWALPFNSDAGLLYYRTTDAPTSWFKINEEVERVFADPAARDRYPGLEAGYTSQLANYEGLTVNALEAIWDAGGEVVDDDGNVVVDNYPDQIREGLDRLRPRRLDPPIVLPAALDSDETASTGEFRAGKVLFMRNWPVAYRNLTSPGLTSPGLTSPGLDSPGLDSPGEDTSGPKFTFGAAPLPGPSVLGGQNLAIAADTAEPRAAQKLIEFLTSARSQQILFERGGFAATREVVYHDPVIKERYPYTQDLLDSIKRARLRPVTPHYARFSEVFRNGVDEALRSGELPEDFGKRLREALKGR